LLSSGRQETSGATPGMERVESAQNGRGFVSVPSRRPFHPWGNNYGNNGRLIEDFWEAEWPAIAQDF
jgi:hypothetical protein